ncbi:hypothetical protein SAMN05428969_2831 [Devosia sp. YR412]|uniref:hypothetical protein n=1 Tax=Devosia sp. YR412 TaxID=1881030 RepID=UPI0008D58A81|nr:hypothetical protein [Devosia sp. YR412]SEQ37909.1 hypothetical protein SAMN05428969_2831 [Devosia sp. YR412]
MKLIQSHPLADEGDRSGHVCIGLIDVEVTPDIRLYKLRVLRMRDGRHRISAPYAGKNLAASFSPELAERLTVMAVDALVAA